MAKNHFSRVQNGSQSVYCYFADTERALIYFILYFDQDIVEHNRAEKSKMMNEKDQQNIIIDRFGPLKFI